MATITDKSAVNTNQALKGVLITSNYLLRVVAFYKRTLIKGCYRSLTYHIAG